MARLRVLASMVRFLSTDLRTLPSSPPDVLVLRLLSVGRIDTRVLWLRVTLLSLTNLMLISPRIDRSGPAQC